MTVETTTEPKVRMVCKYCGSTDVARDAWAEWDEDAQEWVLGPVYDYSKCLSCEEEKCIIEVPIGEEVEDNGDESDAAEADR
jgi:hypothetical protein